MERAKILVVDDESRMRKLVKGFHKRRVYSIRSRRWNGSNGSFTKIKTLP